MKKILSSLLVSAVVLASASAQAVELAGIRVPEKMTIAEHVLVLNGAGVRKKMVFDVYLASLYVAAKTSDASVVMNSATPRKMQLTMLRNVEAPSLYQALLEGLQGNVPASQLKDLAPKMAELEKIFSEMKSANKGEVIVLDFLPGQGSKISARGRVLGLIEGDAFASALLSIWLGKAPVSEDLKKQLLGNP
ncbi:MAG: chalcone isomerase family protein [Deefgea sp.]